MFKAQLVLRVDTRRRFLFESRSAEWSLRKCFGKSQPVVIDLDGTRGMGFVSALQSGPLNHDRFSPTGNDRNTQCEEPAGMDIVCTCIRALQRRGPEMALAGGRKAGFVYSLS